MTGHESTVQRGTHRDGAVTPELIEAAAEALYESQRQPEYTGTEYDWPNMDSGYDRDDEDDTTPEWCRNTYRADARVVAAVVVPLIREQIAAEIEAKRSRAFTIDYNAGIVTAARVARGEDR